MAIVRISKDEPEPKKIILLRGRTREERRIVDTSKKERLLPKRSKEWFASKIDLERGESISVGLPNEEIGTTAIAATTHEAGIAPGIIQGLNTLPGTVLLTQTTSEMCDTITALSPLDELSRLGQEIQGGDEEDMNYYNPLIRQGKITITENSVRAEGSITLVEILSAPEESIRSYVEMLVDPEIAFLWSSMVYPVRLPVRRNTLALELHCLLIQSDEIMGQLVFWNGKGVVPVEFEPPEVV